MIVGRGGTLHGERPRMIGRDEPVKPFELIRWVRAQGPAHKLRELEAHVLLVLATYADDQAIAWPSLATLSRDCRRSRSQISEALRRLEALQLVWSTQGGNGRSARRELLFNPRSQQSGHPDGCEATADAPAVRLAGLQQSGQPDPNGQRTAMGDTGLSESPNQTAKSSSPANRTAATNRRGPRPIGDIIGEVLR